MKRLVKGFMWLVVFMFLLLVLDQVLLRYQGFERPFLRDVQEFHADFRQRLFGLPGLQHSDPEPASGSKPGPSFGAQGSVQTSVDAVVEREITRATQQISTECRTSTLPSATRIFPHSSGMQCR
jgi:hypothetical protein